MSLGRYWTIPQVEDRSLQREVRLLFGVTRPQLLAYLLSAPLFLLPGVSSGAAAWASTALLLLGALAFATALVLAHGGRIAGASWVVIGTGLVTEMVSVALFGGLRGVVAGSLLLSVLVAGVLRGWRAAALTAGGATAFVFLELGLESAGLAPALLPSMVTGAAVVTVLAMLAMTAALLALYARELARASEAARLAAAEGLATEQRLAEMVREAPDGFAVLDAQGRLISCNPALLRISGYGEADLIGKQLADFPGIPSEQVRRELVDGLTRALADGHGGVQADVVRKDGSPLVIETRVRLVVKEGGAPQVHVVVRDVTERVTAERQRARLEADLLDARRMESVGRLAGGIAHDFRNLLTPVLTNASLMARDPDLSPHEARQLALEVEDAAQKASALTGQLLAFARRQRLDVRPLDLHLVLSGLQPILRRLIREDVPLRFEQAGWLPAVRADRSQLEQVVVNLVANARDAMPDGGTVTVTTGVVELDAAQAAARPGARPGRHVVLSVADTGVGMSEEVRAQAFDPFFTTKEPGSGTGLGLATVDGIVAQCGGHLRVESAPGRGSVFHVYLPADEVPAPALTPQPTMVPLLPRGASVLVVDDSELPRMVIARTLRDHGFVVVEAADGAAALELARAAARPLDLLVSDVVMPGLSGPALAARMRALFPRVRILLVSGYSEEVVDLEPLRPGARFLAKPFTYGELLAEVAESFRD